MDDPPEDRFEKRTKESRADEFYGRALLTEANRDLLTGERKTNANHTYKENSMIRRRIKTRLPEDMDLLEAQNSEIYNIIYDIVKEKRDY